MIAALYVQDRGGAYADLEGVDPWSEDRVDPAGIEPGGLSDQPELSAKSRSATPKPFRDQLIDIANGAAVA